MDKRMLFRGGVYEVKSRNLIVAAYDGEQGFVGIREKMGDEYLFTEYLSREWGGTKIPFDTVTPVAYMATLDEDIPVRERGDPVSRCDTCGTRAWFVQDPQIQDGRTRGWWECEGRCFVDGETKSRATQNDVLFEILRELEAPVDARIRAEDEKRYGPKRRLVDKGGQ